MDITLSDPVQKDYPFGTMQQLSRLVHASPHSQEYTDVMILQDTECGVSYNLEIYDVSSCIDDNAGKFKKVDGEPYPLSSAFLACNLEPVSETVKDKVEKTVALIADALIESGYRRTKHLYGSVFVKGTLRAILRIFGE